MAHNHVWREANAVASAFGQVSAFLLKRGGAAQRGGAPHGFAPFSIMGRSGNKAFWGCSCSARRVGESHLVVGCGAQPHQNKTPSYMAHNHVWREANAVASAFGQVSAFLLKRGGAAQRGGACHRFAPFSTKGRSGNGKFFLGCPCSARRVVPARGQVAGRGGVWGAAPPRQRLHPPWPTTTYGAKQMPWPPRLAKPPRFFLNVRALRGA